MKGRRRNGFFKTVDDSKIYSNLRARLKLSEDRSLPSRENLKGKKALLITLRLLKWKNKRKTSGKTSRKTHSCQINKQASMDGKTQVGQKNYFIYFFLNKLTGRLK